MVERTKNLQLEEFQGVVEVVEVTKSGLKDDVSEQYHIAVRPTNVSVGGQTGMIHEWVRISAKCTPTSVPEGSVLDRYLQEVEDLIPSAKKCVGHAEVFSLLKGKKFVWRQKKLGKSFDKHEAKDYWCPKQLL